MKKRTNLCLLDAFNKFRLCTTVYAAWRSWQRGKAAPDRWFVIQEFDDITCLEDVTITFKSSLLNKFEKFPEVDILPCAVDGDLLYITGDEVGPHSVFLVQRNEIGEFSEYSLSSHVKGIASLTNELRLELMVDVETEGDSQNF